MERQVKINVLNSGTRHFLGYENENRATEIVLFLTEEMLNKNIYIEFEKPNGTKVTSAKAEVTNEDFKLDIANKTATFVVTNSLTDSVGLGRLEVVIRDNDNMVWKTSTYNYVLSSSINASEEIEEEANDFMTEAQNKLDEMENLNVEGEEVENGVDITFTDKNGTETIKHLLNGETGPAGHTPVKTVDYWTQEDKQEIEAEVENDVLPQIDTKITAHNTSGLSHADIRTLITLLNALVPAQASAENKLADKSFVNSSIATNTATFRGTYNSLAELEEQVADINDYGFVISTDENGNTVYNRYKYGTEWEFEYALNNSSFTANQWEAINSGITQALVQLITTNQENIADILADYIKSTDYANKNGKAGVIMVPGWGGLSLNTSNGFLNINAASNALIDAKTNQFLPIVPSNLNYAVRSVLPLTSNTLPTAVEGISTLVAQTEYYLNEQTSLNIAFPNGVVGQYCYLCFTAGNNATITINGTNIAGDTEIILTAGKSYEIFANFNGSKWVISYLEV